jgi:hypothetical protein
MKKLTALLLVAVFLVIGSGYALAWSPQLQGRPDQFRPGDSRGVFVWRDDNGLHLRTTTHGRLHVFSGVVRTNGHFVDVRSVRGERNDFSRLSADRDTITFRFRTAGDVDGLDFRIRGGEEVEFDLFMDGRRIDTREIYLGHRGWHPRRSEFTLHR